MICALLIRKVAIIIVLMQSTSLYAQSDLKHYCIEKGGRVVVMTARYHTAVGLIEGLSTLFCTFERDHGLIAVGLNTFASEQPNIAATYMQKLPEIKEGSSLFKGGPGNPSYNVCKNLGGTAISYYSRGAFSPSEGGESDICVFGDGSMISGWSLIYMANHRNGYDDVKRSVKSSPLPINLPDN